MNLKQVASSLTVIGWSVGRDGVGDFSNLGDKSIPMILGIRRMPYRQQLDWGSNAYPLMT